MSEGNGLERVNAPKIGGTLPHDEYIFVLISIGKSLKRIADALEPTIVESTVDLDIIIPKSERD